MRWKFSVFYASTNFWWISTTLFLCHLQPIMTCEEDGKDGDAAKQLQCSMYNGRRVFGEIVNRWKYVNGGSNPCELACWAVSYNFQYSFGKLRDGTVCISKEKTIGICKNGRCESLLMDTTTTKAFTQSSPENHRFIKPTVKLMSRPKSLKKRPMKWFKNGLKHKFDLHSQMNSVIDSYDVIIPTFKPFKRKFQQFKLSESQIPANSTQSGVQVTPASSEARDHLRKYSKKRNMNRKKRIKHRKNGQRRVKKERTDIPRYCQKCKRIKNARKNFCESDFVLRMKVVRSTEIGREARYEVYVVKTYKSSVPMLTKEYIWSPTLCSCPNLRQGKEYIVMGKLEANLNGRESRLAVYHNSYTRRYGIKSVMKILRMKSRQQKLCKQNNRRG